jgi:hypothetical protein
MNFSLSGLAAGLIFSTFGFAIFRQGRKSADGWRVLIGAVLFLYPYFISSNFLLWGIGSILMAVHYFVLPN